MPTASVNLDYLTRQSVINWLGATATHGVTLGVTNIYHQDATDDYQAPCVVVKADVGNERIYGSGWFDCVVEVELHTVAYDTTRAVADGYWKNLRAILGWDALAARLSDLSGYHCWIVVREAGEGNEIQDNRQVRTYRFNCVVMANDNT